MALTKVTNSMTSGAEVNVFDFMTIAQIADVQARTSTIDTKAAIQAAIDSLAPTGGVVRMPPGRYRTESKLVLATGVSLVGSGMLGGTGAYDQGATTIYGVHDGTAILSLVGAASCMVSDLCLQTAAVAPWPQTGLILGRSTSASAGYHKIIRLSAYGNFTAYNVFSIASEDNYWEDLNLWNYALGGAKSCFYTSIGNSVFTGVTESLFTSSNLNNTFVKFWITNANPDADASCMFIDNAEGMGNFSFFGGYYTAAGGSYVTIRNGAIDGLSAIGTYTFSGTNGERLAGGDPLYGFDLQASINCYLSGLCITNCRLDFQAGTNHYQIRKSSNLALRAPNIVMQPPEAFPYALTDVFRDKVLGGILSIGREYAWTDLTLEPAWSTTLGAPYAQPQYCVDACGFVHFRGQIVRSVGGSTLMFYLPATVRPPVDMYFMCANGATVGRLLLTSSTGGVALDVGTVTNSVDLNSIAFNMI